MNKEYNDQIEGRNAVLEYLESGKDINKILITKGEKHGSINKIIAIAKERKIIISELERKLKRILYFEDSTPNYFRQHITDLKNKLSNIG